MQRAQQNAAYTRSGKGRKRKLTCLDQFHNKEKNYINYRLHVYSRRLIDLCVQHKAGMLVLKKEQETEQSPFILRNWNYAGLKRKIEYKAAKTGITVKEETPSTSSG